MLTGRYFFRTRVERRLFDCRSAFFAPQSLTVSQFFLNRLALSGPSPPFEDPPTLSLPSIFLTCFYLSSHSPLRFFYLFLSLISLFPLLPFLPLFLPSPPSLSLSLSLSLQQQHKVRLLLLGAGESGKSTIFKQMRILYGAGFTDDDRHHYVNTVHSNVLSCVKTLCEQASEFGLAGEVACQAEYKAVLECSDQAPLTAEMGAMIKTLWADKALGTTWDRRSEYQIIESNAAYFDSLDRISSFGYTPTDEDILLSRVRTTGIVEEAYEIEGATFEIIDVGGQRNERKKWIHCFEDVNAIIYVAALSEYDQQLFEDTTTNRMVEALSLFGEMCNSPWFEKTDMILFLNKRDLFAKKIAEVNIASVPAFADSYKGSPFSYDEGVDFFVQEFIGRNKAEKDIFYHVTCATDSNNVSVVFDGCRDSILKKNLEDSGFMS